MQRHAAWRQPATHDDAPRIDKLYAAREITDREYQNACAVMELCRAAGVTKSQGVAEWLRVQGHVGGTHHLSGAPDTSWADFARAIMARAALPCQILDIPTSAYPTPARRPLNSRMDCSSLHAAFGVSRPDWQQGLDRILKELSI